MKSLNHEGSTVSTVERSWFRLLGEYSFAGMQGGGRKIPPKELCFGLQSSRKGRDYVNNPLVLSANFVNQNIIRPPEIFVKNFYLCHDGVYDPRRRRP